ncbi:hypothetical protein D7D52_26520 [Nocardia yunnanensis]|uniref:Beta-ketoacyl-[acyl-carrier-protein] synthase III N-terminal domain-containing protein n=1 Tax=Nocardia yunnanensis TaxID=2382165 RepID=A0A386ZGU4_9NOCA|nr:hypothetical protein [Nocardia yunnanensis]AYF76778.1 hypothetical protein D7D52_26520 [Nocardia yunnanensis]
MTNAAYLHSIGWAHGERRSFLDELGADSSIRTRTAQEGIEHYYQAHCAPWQLAQRAAAVSMDRAGLTAQDLDLILYSTESTDLRTDISKDPNRFAESIGATVTPCFAVTGNVCANFGAALAVARNAVRLGEHRTVLIVTTDIWDERPRLVDAGTCLMSDAAAAAIVSLDVSGTGWRIGRITPAVDHGMHAVDPGVDTMHMVRGTVAGVQRAFRGFFTDASAADYDHLVCGNLGDTVIQMFARVGGFEKTPVLRQTAANGHCLAADVLVNLDTFSSDMADGARVMAVSSGHNYWTCIDLTVVREAVA